ncbi:carboxylesterase family protein [Sphingomonas sp. LB3N6]|uniref:carboxylesterase/lipase family protein n=1 Tax=Sphingomonas fucosidasi TaxID=3096164 RepID=UPI002FCBB0E9
MILALALAAAAAPAASGPVVRTDDGPVHGAALTGGGAVFRGIRFAKPPVGPLRWRAPERPAPWTKPVDTIAEHPACAQLVYGDWNRAAAQTSSEDCLFLDVRTPTLADADTAAKPLPVLVWIHGGANRAGAGGGTVESKITDSGIVLVSVQYRLGALGFLSHPALSREQGGHSGNYALMDQQAALGWVQRNIARFGGDPRRVTIAGESAGAQDVALHRLAPASRRLFAQAIQESGTAGFGVAPRSLAQNERLGALIATTAGLPAAATAAQLRTLPVDSILAAQDAVDVPDLDDDSFIWLQAVVDGRVLTDTPAHLLATGKVSRAPLIAGVNARELTLHGGLPAAAATIRREFGPNADRAAALYGLQPGGTPVTDPRLSDVTVQLANDLTFRCPTVALSKALTRVGVPVWQYQFDYARPGGTVSHASELGYVFNAAKPGEPPLQAYWTNFVKTGNPNGAGLPHWPLYSHSARGYLAFDQAGPVARKDLRGPICALRDAP